MTLVEQGWQAREAARRQRKRREWTRDEKEVLNFVNTDTCRRLVLAQYFDEERPVDCIAGEMARCDRCGSGPTDWERSQRATAEERGTMVDTLDQVASGCAVCWISAAITGTGDWLHDGRRCQRRWTMKTDHGQIVDMSDGACNAFRERTRYLDSSRTCFRCGISQKLCNTKEEGQGRCQWPGVAIPVVRAAMGHPVGRKIIGQAGYEGEMDDWDAYALWLGQPHRLRLWGELASNSMVVIKGFLIYCRREMEGRLDIGDDVEDEEGMEGAGVEDDNGKDEGPTGSDVKRRMQIDSPYVEREEARAMGVVIDVEELRQMVDEWKQLCVLCKLHGRSGNGHQHWRQCTGAPHEREKMEKAVQVLVEVRFADFSQCMWCNRSQAMCELWERKVNASGRVVFKRQAGKDCVYGRWLLEAAAGLLAFRTKDGLDEWMMADPSFGRLKETMERKLRRGEVEFSGMFMYFYQWS